MQPGFASPRASVVGARLNPFSQAPSAGREFRPSRPRVPQIRDSPIPFPSHDHHDTTTAGTRARAGAGGSKRQRTARGRCRSTYESVPATDVSIEPSNPRIRPLKHHRLSRRSSRCHTAYNTPRAREGLPGRTLTRAARAPLRARVRRLVCGAALQGARSGRPREHHTSSHRPDECAKDSRRPSASRFNLREGE